MNIDLNFEDTYDLEIGNSELTEFAFNSPVAEGEPVRIEVKIQSTSNQFLQEFLNLAFGPVIENNGIKEIDDFASVPHINQSKALSTVLLCGLVYLKSNPDRYLGIDGSDFRRAYYYYRIIQRNFAYLQAHFKLFGAKYYARVLRGQDKHSNLPVDPNELIYIPYIIENAPLTNHKSLFNYFLLYLR